MLLDVKPRGSRVLVEILSLEHRTRAGILVPGLSVPGGSGPAQGDGQPKQELKFCKVLEVGQGKLNHVTGEFMPSRWKPGDYALMRFGISAIVHIDYIPGESCRALVQEDILAGLLEGFDPESHAQDTPPLPIGQKEPGR